MRANPTAYRISFPTSFAVWLLGALLLVGTQVRGQGQQPAVKFQVRLYVGQAPRAGKLAETVVVGRELIADTQEQIQRRFGLGKTQLTAEDEHILRVDPPHEFELPLIKGEVGGADYGANVNVHWIDSVRFDLRLRLFRKQRNLPIALPRLIAAVDTCVEVGQWIVLLQPLNLERNGRHVIALMVTVGKARGNNRADAGHLQSSTGKGSKQSTNRTPILLTSGHSRELARRRASLTLYQGHSRNSVDTADVWRILGLRDKLPLPEKGVTELLEAFRNYASKEHLIHQRGKCVLRVSVLPGGRVCAVKVESAKGDRVLQAAKCAVYGVQWTFAARLRDTSIVWVPFDSRWLAQVPTPTEIESHFALLNWAWRQEIDHPAEPSPEVDEDVMPMVVGYDRRPEPVGGFEAIQRNLEYPEIARKSGVEGRVVVYVLVDEHGNVVDTKVLKSLGNNGCDEAAIKAIKSVKWKPAMQRDRAVKVWVAIPVIFSLENSWHR